MIKYSIEQLIPPLKRLSASYVQIRSNKDTLYVQKHSLLITT